MLQMKTLGRALLKDIRINVLIVILLALGLSVNTTVFSIVNGLLLKPLPFAEPDKLVFINESKPPDLPKFSVASGNFLDWQAQNTSFESLAAISENRFNLVEGNTPESVTGIQATASFWSTLRVKPALGRAFTEEEDQPGKPEVVIISNRLWVRRFGSDPNILGRAITVNAKKRTVIGVMPEVSLPDPETDIWMPIEFNAEARANHGGHTLAAIGRLKPNTSVDQALTDLKRIARQLEVSYPDSNQGWSVLVTPLREEMVGEFRQALLVLWGAVGFVLLIACANIANLLLGRSLSRQHDFAVRIALGATRFQIARQVLAETVVLALVGGIGGLMLARWGVHALLSAVNQPILTQRIRIEPTVFAFTAVLSVVTGIVFGLFPAIQLSRTEPNEYLKDASRGSSAGPGRRRLRSALVVAEVSLSLVLLIGAGLTIRSFLKLSHVNPGFNPANVLTVELTLPDLKYEKPDQRRQFVDAVLPEIANLPGVTFAGVTQVLPFTGNYVLAVLFEGRPPAKPSDVPSTNYYAVSPDYFRAMGIPLKRGRYFTSADRQGAGRVAVVSESFVARFYPNEDALGKRIHITNGPQTWREIVGIVGDTKQSGLDQKSPEQAYEPIAQVPFSFMTFVVKTAGNPMSLAHSVEQRIQHVDPEQPVTMMRPMQQILDQSIADSKTGMWLFATFGTIALLMATTGLYGVMAYSVTQQTREIGVRMALGAGRARVLRLVIRNGMILTSVGLLIGLAGSLALTQLMHDFLYETSPTDPMIFAGIALTLAVISLLACYIPAWRASRVDPVIALRHE
jgi:putative ABC transport system permease protein